MGVMKTCKTYILIMLLTATVALASEDYKDKIQEIRSRRRITFVKASTGDWKCQHTEGRSCTNSEIQLVNTELRTIKSVGKVRQLTVNPNGTLNCIADSKNACSDAELRSATSAVAVPRQTQGTTFGEKVNSGK